MAEILKTVVIGKVKYAWVTTGETTAIRVVHDKDEAAALRKGERVKAVRERLREVQGRIRELESTLKLKTP